MKHIGSQRLGIALPSTSKCSNPTCPTLVVDVAAKELTHPIERLRGYLCATHLEGAVRYEAERVRKLHEDARSAPRRMIEDRADHAIPKLYRDVLPLTSKDHPEHKQRLAVLHERLNCDDFVGVYQAAKSAAEMLLTTSGSVVLLAGLTGTGKSSVAALVIRLLTELIPLLPWKENAVMKPGGLFGEDWPLLKDSDPGDPRIIWTTATDLFDLATAHEPIGVYKHAPIAVIDDIGNEGDQSNAKPVTSVVWSRHQDKLSSLLTTGWVDPNADPADLEAYLAPLAKRYSTAFVRRVAQPNQSRFKVIALRPRA